MSSQSDTSLTFQWGFSLCDLFVCDIFFKTRSLLVSVLKPPSPRRPPPKARGARVDYLSAQAAPGHPGLRECQWGEELGGGGGINCQENTGCVVTLIPSITIIFPHRSASHPREPAAFNFLCQS